MASASTFVLFVRLGVAMAIVMGLMFLVSASMKKRGIVSTARRGNGPRLDLVARRGLGRNAQVAVVRTNGRDLILGVTDHQVTLLAETEVVEIDLDDIDGVDDTDTSSDGATGALAGKRRGRARTAPPNGGQFATPGQAWKTMFEHLRERTVRR
jgi:flagellar protein FliO/FliZ